MKLHDVLITHLSRRPARVARKLLLFFPVWMVVGSLLLAVVGLNGGFVVLNILGSLFATLLSAVVALAFRTGTELGALREGKRGAISVATGGILARVGERELSDRVVSGVREEVAGIHQVVLELQSGDAMAVEVKDAAESEAILDAAGVTMRQRAIGLHVGRVHGRVLRMVLAALYILSILVGLPSALGLVATLADAFRHMSSHTEWFLGMFLFLTTVSWGTFALTGNALSLRSLQLGQDGLLVQSGRYSKKFLPWDGLKLRRVGARIGLRSGDRTARLAAGSDEEALSLVHQIEEAKAAYDRREELGAALLSRNGRKLDAWRDDLRGLTNDEGYRAPIGRADLASIAEDPRAPRDQRIGAVLALSTLPDDAPERARLRVAIETTADPKLRVALERACDDELDDALVEAAEAR